MLFRSFSSDVCFIWMGHHAYSSASHSYPHIYLNSNRAHSTLSGYQLISYPTVGDWSDETRTASWHILIRCSERCVVQALSYHVLSPESETSEMEVCFPVGSGSPSDSRVSTRCLTCALCYELWIVGQTIRISTICHQCLGK